MVRRLLTHGFVENGPRFVPFRGLQNPRVMISLAPLENWGAHTSIETPGCEATGSAEFLRPKMSVLGGTGGFADILMHFSVTCNYGGVGTLMQV